MQAFAFASPLPSRTTLSPARCSRIPKRITCEQDETIVNTESSAMVAAAATFVLKKASETYLTGAKKPDPAQVSTAILQLEREQKRNKMKSDIEKLQGQWRLILTANPKSKNPFTKSFYFPLRAHQTFIPAEDGTLNEGIFDNGVFLFGGAANFRVSGPFRWTPKLNLLEFTVDKVTVKIGTWNWEKNGLDPEGSSLEGRTVKTLPFFKFFSVRSDIACARGRSGGLAVYARVAEDERL